MGGPSVIMSKEEEEFYKAGRAAATNVQVDLGRFYAANFPPQFQDVPSALTRILGGLAQKNPDAILAANFFHSLVDQTIKAKQGLAKLEKELTPLINDQRLHEKDRQLLKDNLEEARANYKKFEEYALVTVAKVQTESTLKQTDYYAQKFFTSCENITVLSKVATEVVAAKTKAESVVTFTHEQLRKRRAVVRLMEEDESAKKGIIKALEDVERDVTAQIRSFRSILQESVLTRFQKDKETGKLVIDQTNCGLVGAVLTFPKRMEAIWKAADAIAWTSIFKDDSFLNEQVLHDPKKLAQIRGYLIFLIESIDQQRKMTTEMKVPVLDSHNRPTSRDQNLLPDKAASKLNEEYEKLKVALRSVLQAIDEIYTDPTAKSSAFVSGSITRARGEKDYLFDIWVITRRMNLAIDQNRILTEEVGSVVGEHFNSYIDKIAGTGLWERIQEPVGDFAVIAMMTLHPTPYTIGFGSAYFAARGGLDLAKEYGTTGKVSFSGVAMAVAGLAGLGGTAFKIVNTARTASMIARGAQLDVGSALSSQKIMLGFELTSSFSGAYLFGEGAVGAVKSTAHGFKYGWTADNVTNLFTSSVFLGLGVKGIKNSPAEIAKVVSTIGKLEAARPVVTPKEFAPRLEPVNVGQMGSMGGNIKASLYREMPVEKIGDAVTKAPNEEATIGSVGGKATAKQALGYLEQVYRTDLKRKDAAQKELENIRDNAADVGLRAYARQILKSPDGVLFKSQKTLEAPTLKLIGEFTGMPKDFDVLKVDPVLGHQKVELIRPIDTETGAGAGVFLGKMPDGTLVAVKVFRSPSGSVTWKQSADYFKGEVAAAKVLSDLGLGPRVYGIVDAGGNMAYAMDVVKGKDPSDMTISELSRYTTPDTYRQLQQMYDALIKAGYQIGDFQFAVLTELQVINGKARKVGDVVFWDAGGLRKIPPGQKPQETGAQHVEGLRLTMEVERGLSHFKTMDTSKPSGYALNYVARKIIKNLSRREVGKTMTEEQFRQFLISGGIASRVQRVESIVAAVARSNRQDGQKLFDALRQAEKESGVQLLSQGITFDQLMAKQASGTGTR